MSILLVLSVRIYHRPDVNRLLLYFFSSSQFVFFFSAIDLSLQLDIYVLCPSIL